MSRFNRFTLGKRRLGWLAAVVTAAAAIAGAAALPASAKPQRANGLIAFARFNPALGDSQIYVINPDGTGQRLVQAPTDTSECPGWSPDGSRIATCGDPSGGASRIINPDDGSYRVVPNPDPANLFLPCGIWSSDGSRLACEGFGLTDPSLNGIYTIRSSDGSGLVRVTSTPGGDDIPGGSSPDGNRIAFCRTTVDALFGVNTNGTGLKQITPQGFGLSSCGNWSPQGNDIVFSRHVTPDVHSSIWVMHADGTGLHEINVQGIACGGANDDPNGIGCFSPAFSPDGTKIVFGLFDARGRNLYTIDANGNNPRQITFGNDDDSPSWGTHALMP